MSIENLDDDSMMTPHTVVLFVGYCTCLYRLHSLLVYDTQGRNADGTSKGRVMFAAEN